MYCCNINGRLDTNFCLLRRHRKTYRQIHCPKDIRTGLTDTEQLWLTSHQCKFKRKHLFRQKQNFLSLLLVFISVIVITILVKPQPVSSQLTSNNIVSQHNKNSGQFSISELCAGKSQFPITKRIEGAVLTSTADTDVNCTITFKTKSNHQHFIMRFEELKLGCDDHLKMFDGDLDYGSSTIKDFSCRDSIASVRFMKTTRTFLTIRFSSDSRTKMGNGFRLVITAVYDGNIYDCPVDHSLCNNQLCISRSLFCDDVNHCIDNSDEASCSSRPGMDGSSSGSFFAGDLTLSNALGLLIVLVLVIFTCVIIFISAVYCRRESHYAQYQHHLQRAIGVPLQTSSSLMFANHQPQYQYFQPANMSPYITPQHHAAIATTLPRGYSTLPLNLARQPQPMQPVLHQQQSPILGKANNVSNNEYLMMAGLSGPPAAAMQASPAVQTNLFMPTSQSILTTSIRCPPPQERR